ncbi:DUF4900 domain-containing protein [Deinococcus koreensis]|uniref:DUF4900 domain-containing protein n=1 Tax=Deinococcus koreensis TaxID=2054903 RepID=A0A2K3UYL3_9DEIO|nr:DUF4900 domain-containing protein [Deinococcus koreensis]PNY81621.1 hypothetical protein CVO96_09755 [Deinococcus koreensis]
MSTRPFPAQRPAHQTGGYILVTALGFLVVLMLMASVVLTGSVSGVQQAGSHSGLVRARAAAEAGQANAAFTLSQTILTGLNATLNTYATQFAQSNKDSAKNPIVPPGEYSNVIASLNGLGTLHTGTVGGANYTDRIIFSNFRADPASFNSKGQRYFVDYRVESTGQVGSFSRNVNVEGTLGISMGRQYLNQFLLLSDDGGSKEGNFYATGMNYDGPVHVNRNWRFAGTPNFSRGATTASKDVEMYNCSSKKYVKVSTSTHSCTQPNWGGFGLQYDVPEIALPANSFSQARAALGLDPSDLSSPSKSERCAALQITSNNCNGNGSGSGSGNGNSGVPDGVYLPTTGGIYIQGDAEIVLSVVSNNQVYAVKQGNQTTTITVTAPNGPTVTRWPNGSTTTVNRVPNGQLYVEGKVSSLKGPPRTGTLPNPLPSDNSVPPQIPPAIASTTKLNVAASSDVVVQGDLTYQDNPISKPAAQNVLGLIAGSGDIQIGTSAPADIYMHGAVLAGAKGKGFSVENYNIGLSKGSIHLLGSLAEDKDPPRGLANIAANGQISIAAGYGDAFNFDPRFLNGAVAPPFFPATTLFVAQGALPAQRTWAEK